LIPTLLLSACAKEPERHYSGPPLPQNEVAVIKGTNHFFLLGDYGVNLSSIDGSRVKADQVEVLAGEHIVKVEAKSSLGIHVGAKQYQEIRFTALAGHRYEIDVEFWSGDFMVTDLVSGEIVARAPARPDSSID